jgi:histidine triad (HIT) family protein
MSEEIIVQDEEIVVLTPKRGIVAGHVIIAPVNEYRILEEVPPSVLSRMFQIANKISSTLFDRLKCHGTNIFIENGAGAGQTNSRFSINIIPRFENDKIKLEWTPVPTEPEKINSAQNRFQEVENADKEKKYLDEQKSKAEETKKTVLIKSGDEKRKRNYFVRSLEKVA